MKFVENTEGALLAAAKDMLRRGLVEGTAGNLSARRADGKAAEARAAFQSAAALGSTAARGALK